MDPANFSSSEKSKKPSLPRNLIHLITLPHHHHQPSPIALISLSCHSTPFVPLHEPSSIDAAMAEKPVPHPPDSAAAAANSHDDTALVGKTSPGVRRIEAISQHFSRRDRWCLFAAVFLIAYVYGLDGTLRFTYQVGALFDGALGVMDGC